MMQLFAWLEGTGLSTWIREADTVWAYPTVLTLHTIGLGVLGGAAAILDLRLLGIGGRAPLAPMRTLFRLMWAGFWINAVTGALLFAADATERGTSWLFFFKMVLVGIGVVTVVLIRRAVDESGENAVMVSGAARRLAIISLVVWTAAVTAGRLLAYV
ncbi:MAG TPA: hypothetical protein VIX63_05695 [Vicinamibacterales bacterium]